MRLLEEIDAPVRDARTFVYPRNRVAHAAKEIEWLRTNWFARPSYLKLNGKPVLLSFGQDGLSDAEWEQVFKCNPEIPFYLSEHRRRPVAAGGFD